MSDWASESGHWYRPDGTPAYTLIGKNGRERATTVRDAREQGLLPSVTTIIRCAAAPGLEKWKRDQLALAMATLPKIEGETWDAFIARAAKDSEEQAAKAREKGSAIHGEIEKYYRMTEVYLAYAAQVSATAEVVEGWAGLQRWKTERSFAHKLGYGGKVDLHSDGWVIDFKTKEFNKDALPKIYDEHLMQLAAYRYGLQVTNARCASVFVSTSEPGLATLMEASEDELWRGWLMFEALLTYYQAKNGLNGIRKAA